MAASPDMPFRRMSRRFSLLAIAATAVFLALPAMAASVARGGEAIAADGVRIRYVDHGDKAASTRLVSIEDAGHGVFVDQPERFNFVLREFVTGAGNGS